MKVLITAPYMFTERKKIERLVSNLPLEFTWKKVEERLEEKDLLLIIGDYDGIICGDDEFTRYVYEKAKNLKVIVKWGTGIDSLNKEIADNYGIKIFRTLKVFNDPVADTTMTYILNFCRKIIENDDILKNGGWSKPGGYSLAEKTVGIIGFGEIGYAVGKRLKGFDTRVMVNDIKEERKKSALQLDVEFVSKEDIYQNCDIISLHCDLNSTSYQLLNFNTFQKMEKKPYIINTARGGLIVEEDLIEALNARQIVGAALDVFEEEPLPLNSPLRKMKNVLLSAHNSNSSPACWNKVHINSIEMLKKGLGVE